MRVADSRSGVARPSSYNISTVLSPLMRSRVLRLLNTHPSTRPRVASLEPGLASAHDVPACAGSASASARRLAASAAMIQSDAVWLWMRRSKRMQVGHSGALIADEERKHAQDRASGHPEGLHHPGPGTTGLGNTNAVLLRHGW